MAIKQVHEWIKDPSNEIEATTCTGRFRRCYGRPCVHEMIRVYQSDYAKILQPTDFDSHWFIRSNALESVGSISEPAIRTTKRRATSKQDSHQNGDGPNGTRRELSHFELDDDTTFEENLIYLDAFLPPRTWGYAGLT
ncbi:hypothetical protein PHMEG_00031819 [Phytophthora megakarya]|uniref:Uncharacterized protein n=1 Tax=Phytophthora megakarya TaxID=4795 RepID=A0A225UZP3_9STRA|nr:hypothetical protein PHMEG_00031819 [Phytophthora megakarya]